MSAERWRNASLAAAMALLALSLSAETCQNGASVATPAGATITITDRFSAVNVPANEIRNNTATASCKAGEVMLSGGYAVTTPAYSASLDQSTPLNRYFIYADYPSSNSTWTVSVLNRAPIATPGSILLTAHVECATGVSGASETPKAEGPIGARVKASCPGVGLTGGGYRITAIDSYKAVVTIVTSFGSIGNGNLGAWNVETAFAEGSYASITQTQVYAYAVCNNLTTTMGARVDVSAPAGPADQATSAMGAAPCGEGQVLTGGGFGLLHVTDSLPVTQLAADYTDAPSRWIMTLYSLPAPDFEGKFGNAGGYASLYPICATVQ
jgi:hypothetical protein